MERQPGSTEAAEGGLKELVMRWFTETQASLILHNGNFPEWFQGLAARKDAEELLRDKSRGCFLIRLSDKAIGYILSYKGHDRCRHFVITQNQDGQFGISGDCQTYGSLTELIEHYKTSPIQPFGEYLTSSCYEVDTGELYDVVNTRGKAGVSVQALRTLWDQKKDPHCDPGPNQRVQHQSDPPAVLLPALPPKSKTRKLTGTMSVDAMSLSQGVPPVPKRGITLGLSLNGSLPDTTSHPGKTQTDSSRAERPRGNTNPVPMSHTDSINTTDTNYPCDLCPPGVTYAESRATSLPRLDKTSMEEEEEEEEEEFYNQHSSPSFMKRVTFHTYSLHTPGVSSSRSERESDDLERSNPLYQTSEGSSGSLAQQGDGMYAEVPERPAGLPDDTYEQIPANTYESLEDTKTKKSKSTWGKNNLKWKKFLPDYMKK